MARCFFLCVIFGLIIGSSYGLPIIFLRPSGFHGFRGSLSDDVPVFVGGQRLQRRSDVALRDVGADSYLLDRMSINDLSELLLRLASVSTVMENMDMLPSRDDSVVVPKGQLRVQRRTPLSDSQSMKLSTLMAGGNTGLLSRPGK